MPRLNSTKILVEDFIETETTSKSGIILPNAVIKAKTLKGKIVLTGEGTADIKMVHNVGENVLFHPNAGTKLTWEDKEYRLIDIADVFLSGV